MISKLKRYIIRHCRLLRCLVWISDNYDNIEYSSADYKEIGSGCIIHPGVTLGCPSRAVLKNNVQIHSKCFIDCTGGLYIGNNVGIAVGSIILTTDHLYRDGSAVPYGPDVVVKPVVIWDNVWIGAHTKILPGVEIGEGAIVGMGSVITKDVRPMAIVFGNPARVVGWRDKDTYEACVREGQFVRHQYRERLLIPEYTRRREKAYDLIREYVETGEMMFLE